MPVVATPEPELPEKIAQGKQSPERPLSLTFRILLGLATMVGGLSSVCIKQLLLPIQVGIIDPVNTNTSFALVASIGAFAGLIASPVFGALSDRTTSRFGRRRPWIIFGVITGVVGLVIMALSTNLVSLIIGEIIAQIGVDTLLSTLTAVIPDQVPVEQRPVASALSGMAPIVGGVLGLVLVARLTDTRSPAQGYYLLAAISFLLIVLFLFVLREKPFLRSELPPFNLGRFAVSFIEPLKYADFTYTLISRCFVFLSFTILGAYTLFYLRRTIHFSAGAAAQGVATFQLISTITLLIAALLAGILSGRYNRLKPFVGVGAILMAIGLFVIVLIPTWQAMLIAAVIFGAGFGTYLAVDIALAVRVLPSTTSNAKDLGIIYTAIFIPLILSPIIGASVLNLSHNNFALLFGVAAVSSILAAVLILPIKGVR
ncbi:MAG: MFS transporter [Ktedonobacteraceae bacterium]